MEIMTETRWIVTNGSLSLRDFAVSLTPLLKLIAILLLKPLSGSQSDLKMIGRLQFRPSTTTIVSISWNIEKYSTPIRSIAMPSSQTIPRRRLISGVFNPLEIPRSCCLWCCRT